jgi:hypothetical protein
MSNTPAAPKIGTCYCGCAETTRKWFRRGHDMRAAAALLPGLSGSAAAHQLAREHGTVVDGVVALRESRP